MSTNTRRLVTTIKPLHYTIRLHASPKRQKFSGSVEIVIDLETPHVDCIALHARDLKVVHIKTLQGKTKHTATLIYQPADEIIMLHFEHALKAGNITVALQFEGRMNQNMHGLYIAKDGKQKAVVSQCEASDARAIFPCFDEPIFKAVLEWHVVTDKDMTVITNGAPIGRRKISKQALVRHTFAPTKAISTYLAAVTIGLFEQGCAFKVGSTACAIFAGPNNGAQTAFAHAVTSYVLPWYEAYFAKPYAFGKLDQVAVPGFDAGAMENIGAIFYRQNLLLMDEATTSWQAQKHIAEVVAHEIAHQWFGNLVTMVWWDDLWLNEAFATWIAYKVCAIWQPAWHIWDDYLISKEGALAVDALQNTHPIYHVVDNPAQATEMFDVITYEKGCGVLRMIENYVGDTVFQQAMQRYCKAFQYSNARGSDLWQQVADVSGAPVIEMMQSWIHQAGFPVLTVTTFVQNKQTHVHISQRRFYAHPDLMQQPTSSTDTIWHIPICIHFDTGNGATIHNVLLTSAEETFILPADSQAHWLYPNAGSTGFYRMHLKDSDLRNLLNHGMHNLVPGERMGLLQDVWAMVQSGLCHIEQFLDTVSAYKHETSHTVLQSISMLLYHMYHQLLRPSDLPYFAKWVAYLCNDKLAQLGYETYPQEPATQRLRRALLVGMMGTLARDRDVLHMAQTLAQQEMHNPAAVEASLANTVVALVAQEGDTNTLQQLLGIYQTRKNNHSTPELQARYLFALTCTENNAALKVLLEACLTDKIPQEQLRSVLTQLLRKRHSQIPTWHFLTKHWQTIKPRIGSMGLARLVDATSALPCDKQNDIAAFFQKNPVDTAERALLQVLESMSLRRNLLQREENILSEWLQEAPYQSK